MPHRIEKYLYDIKESIDSIDEYLGDKRVFLNIKETSYSEEG
jgi:uncharacterized protein with HEPN domain